MKGDIFGKVYQQFCMAIKKDKWKGEERRIFLHLVYALLGLFFSWQCKYMHDVYLWLCSAEW
jgi:hypothetical protein